MSNPFTSTSVVNYNSNPPADDGSQVPANLVAWATIKTKLPDPIKTAFDTSETNTNNAFAKVMGGGGITSTAVNYTVLSADQGKFVKVTAAATITTPDATAVGSPFVFVVVNESAGDITLAGNNPGVQQTVDGANTVTIPSGAGVHVNTDGTNWFTSGQNFTKTQIVPQCRLTLVSATPVITSDQTAKTAVFLTPYNGNLMPIPINGTVFTIKQFSELTLTLNGTNYVAGNIYDVFASVDPADGSTVIVGSGPAWTTATAGSGARGTGVGTTELVILNGLNVNKNAITLRNNATTYSIIAKGALYVGSIYVDTTNGQLNCHTSFGQSRKWGVWNAFNRVPVYLKAGDSTASWTYAINTWRPSNNSTANSLTVFQGLPEESYNIEFVQRASITASGESQNGIGFNSTTATSGKTGFSGNSGVANVNTFDDLSSKFLTPPSLGINVFTALENTIGNTTTFNGTESFMLLTAAWRA